MNMDGAVQIIKPASDSQYRLVPCKCGSDNVAYVLCADGKWRGHCFECGHSGAGAVVRHEGQVMWNYDTREVSS